MSSQKFKNLISQMSFLSHNKLKILLGIVGVILIIQIIRMLPLLQSLQLVEIDHSPRNDGTFPPVTVAVYYETLCPDSKNFINNQLVPTHRKAPNLIRVVFIPYGKASTHESENGELSFSCQHGPDECLGNKIHGCAIEALTNSSKNQIEFISCTMMSYDPLVKGHTCAHKYGIDWEPIRRCATGEEGSLMLKKNGLLTSKLSPKVSFIPTVTLDNEQLVQRLILKNLFKEICLHFKVIPDECKDLIS